MAERMRSQKQSLPWNELPGTSVILIDKKFHYEFNTTDGDSGVHFSRRLICDQCRRESRDNSLRERFWQTTEARVPESYR